MSRDDAKTKTNRLSGVSTASAYAAAADAAEAAARAYASRAEEARRARSAFLNDEAAARRAADSESPESGRGRLATSPDANDARRGFRGGTPPPADAAFLPTPRDSAQAWSRGGLSRVARLTPEQQDAVVWILGLGVSVAGASVAGDVVVGLPRATGIQAEMAKGALLCRLAETLEGTHLGETHRRPKVKAEATHNINKALAVFRRAGRVAPRYLWSAAELAEGDAKSAWGVLFDIRAAYDAGFEKSASKRNSPNTPGGRVRGRRLRVTPRVDARGGAYGDPGDVVAAEAGEGRLPRTPPRAGTGAPFRERNADVSFASRGEKSATFKSPKHGGSSGVASWRRAAPGVPLTARGLPSPLARAAAKVAAARAKRVARLMGDADRAEKTAKIRRAVAADAAATATRAAFEAAAAEAELEAAEEEEALLALEAAARADAAERAKMRDGAAGARFSRGGAVKGALSRDAKARAASARAARPDFVPSGYVSPNENARRRSRSLTRDRDKDATRAERTRTTSPSPRDAAASENGTARRGLTFSSAAPKCAERADLIDVEPPRAKQPKAKETEHSRVASLARRAAETAALAGAVPVVFEYREGPLPAPPPSAERDEEVRLWLASLRLSVLPREEEADLLSNPLRNGTLLRDVMTVLVGAPPLTRRERNPRTLDQARLNVEKALAPLRAVPGAVPPGLTWSTEGVLKGIREHTFGLLWYVKRAALGRVAGSEARRRESLESAGIVENAREGPPAAGALGGGLARASTPARSRRLFDDGDENVLSSSSSSPPHYAGVPTAEGGAKKRSSSKTTSVPGRVFRSSADNEKNAYAGTTVGASASESVSPSDSSPREYDSSLSGSEKTNAHWWFRAFARVRGSSPVLPRRRAAPGGEHRRVARAHWFAGRRGDGCQKVIRRAVPRARHGRRALRPGHRHRGRSRGGRLPQPQERRHRRGERATSVRAARQAQKHVTKVPLPRRRRRGGRGGRFARAPRGRARVPRRLAAPRRRLEKVGLKRALLPGDDREVRRRRLEKRRENARDALFAVRVTREDDAFAREKRDGRPFSIRGAFRGAVARRGRAHPGGRQRKRRRRVSDWEETKDRASKPAPGGRARGGGARGGGGAGGLARRRRQGLGRRRRFLLRVQAHHLERLGDVRRQGTHLGVWFVPADKSHAGGG
jgi:hypothetical protein